MVRDNISMPDVIATCAIIEHKGKVLIVRKKMCDHPLGIGGKWIFPRVKSHKKESIAKCLKREVKEETAMDVKPKEKITRRIFRK
jgi:ADP-ribose pyrophosphatase YjhB (NUDIX family)